MRISNSATAFYKDNLVQVDVLHKGEWIAPPRVRQYYGVSSGPIFESALRPNENNRLVFLEQGTANYLIIPDNGAYRFEAE
jgi:hypothetical protein